MSLFVSVLVRVCVCVFVGYNVFVQVVRVLMCSVCFYVDVCLCTACVWACVYEYVFVCGACMCARVCAYICVLCVRDCETVKLRERAVRLAMCSPP